jgi:anti-sigma28 factor (negative regulator of flagellin synthesis)
MSSIHGIGGNNPVHKVAGQPAAKPAAATEAGTPTRSADKLELSGVTHLMQALKMNDVRIDKVTAIKQLIESGMYEDDAKLDATVDKLLDELTK